MCFPIEYCVSVTVNIYHNAGRYSLNSMGTGFRIIVSVIIFYLSKNNNNTRLFEIRLFKMFKGISTNGGV